MSTPARPAEDAPVVTLAGMPKSCPYCHVTDAEVTEWLLGVQGRMLQVICPRCFTAVAPVTAVAAVAASQGNSQNSSEEDGQ